MIDFLKRLFKIKRYFFISIFTIGHGGNSLGVNSSYVTTINGRYINREDLINSWLVTNRSAEIISIVELNKKDFKDFTTPQ